MAIYSFQPTQNTNFSFQPTLDGSVYNVIVTWSLFGRRFYVNIYSLDGVRIVTLPLIGSPLGSDISLVDGYFTTKLIYRQPSRQFEVI